MVCALKIEAVPPAPKVGRVAALDHAGVAVLGGAGGIDFWHELERGADGTVPGVAMAELFLAVQAHHDAGDRDAARRLFNRHLPLIALGDTRHGHVLRGPAPAAQPCAASRPHPVNGRPSRPTLAWPARSRR